MRSVGKVLRYGFACQFLFTWFATTTELQAQTLADSLFMKGAELMQLEQYGEAATVLDRARKADSLNLQTAFLLGQAYYLSKNYRKAAITWEAVDQRNYRQQTVRYNLASTYARLGDKERTFTWLAQALEAGFNRLDALQSDTVFAFIRSDDRFEKVLEVADQNARPCEYDPVYRIMDFWLGDWEVYAYEGQKVGESRIQKTVNGCAIQEEYQQGDGFVGQNLFYYNNITGEWKMIWITGAAIALGGLKEKIMAAKADNGSLRFIGQLPNQDGSKILDRSTITPISEERVNMVIQQSRDGGDNWVTTFSGYYQRVKE
jgi:tetratricopeptide (TPR) repeat protein